MKKTDRVDDEIQGIAFPLSYCLVCHAPLSVFVSSENGIYYQDVKCRVCHCQSGIITLRPASLLAGGTVSLGDVTKTYNPSFLLHEPLLEEHITAENIHIWTAIPV